MTIAESLQSLAEPLANLTPAGSNPRKGDVDAIMRSYERFGQRKPIVAQKQTGEIIAGNHQYEAAKRLGWDKIAVVWVDDDPQTATAYSVADNRIGQLGEWDVEELVASFEVMSDEDIQNAGFEQVDVEDFKALFDEQVGSVAAVGDQSDGQARTSKADGDPNQAVIKDKSYQEFLDRYMTKATRAIMLYYQADDYAKMVDGLDKLGEHFGDDDHADTVQRLVNDALSNLTS